MLVVHLVWILWVILGLLLASKRPWLRALHILSLVYSIAIELLPWPPCPLTIAEQSLESRAGIQPYHEPFLVHYLEALIYPDISQDLLVWSAVTVCLLNLGAHAVLFIRSRRAGQ